MSWIESLSNVTHISESWIIGIICIIVFVAVLCVYSCCVNTYNLICCPCRWIWWCVCCCCDKATSRKSNTNYERGKSNDNETYEFRGLLQSSGRV